MTDRSLGVPPVPASVAVAAFLLFLVPGLVGYYGPFIDELYYVACASHLAWGYVDHPPLSPALLALSRSLLGDGLVALRVPAALAGAMTVLLAGLLARRLGAGKSGQLLASAAVALSPIIQLIFGFYSMNAFELLMWTVMAWLLVELALGAHPRLWLAFGVVAGLALMNKHTVVLFVFGLGVGMLATSARRQLATGWPYAGAAVAGLIFAPNLIWQMAHGWPSLEFYRNASFSKQVSVPMLQVLVQQMFFNSPGTLPIWLAGLIFLIGGPLSSRLRHLGLAFLAVLAVMVVGHEGRPDRISGFYPLLLAAGGVQIERFTDAAGRRRWWRPALGVWMTAWGFILLPITVPVLPPAQTARWASALGASPQLERGAGKRTELPQWFADRLGWQLLVNDVAAARAQLTPDEQSRVVFFAPSYGQAGALDWLGAKQGLRPVYSSHNTYYLWGPPRDPVDVAIVTGNDPDRLAELFEEVQLAGIYDCDFCMPWRDQMPIWIVRRARVRISDQWPEWKHFE
ncbi:MAG: glycosyltransferase family 39 protein [Acidobacteriota bacterium]